MKLTIKLHGALENHKSNIMVMVPIWFIIFRMWDYFGYWNFLNCRGAHSVRTFIRDSTIRVSGVIMFTHDSSQPEKSKSYQLEIARFILVETWESETTRKNTVMSTYNWKPSVITQWAAVRT